MIRLITRIPFFALFFAPLRLCVKQKIFIYITSILKLSTNLEFPSLTDDDLVCITEELFLELDRQETDWEIAQS